MGALIRNGFLLTFNTFVCRTFITKTFITFIQNVCNKAARMLVKSFQFGYD